MLLRYIGWHKAADFIIKGLNGAIANKEVTYDFHRLMKEAKLLKCSEFANAIITHMES